MERDPSIGSGCWYLGQVYINPADQRIIVRKRTRLGWTLNFARPLAVPVLLLMMAYAAAPFYLLDRFGFQNLWAFVVVVVSLAGFSFLVEKNYE